MKYAMIIPDGFADEPIASLGDRTPMQVAATPNLDRLAKEALLGCSHNVPPTLPPGSDVATMALLGYDPTEVYTGRAPLEAAALGIELGPLDWALRCNLVTLTDGRMASFTAGHITSGEAADLIGAIQSEIAPRWNEWGPNFPGTLEFFPGVSYRNLVVFRPENVAASKLFSPRTETFPPHDYTDQPFAQALPTGEGSDELRRLMSAIHSLLREHPVNRARRASEKLPATDAWLWGLGKRPRIERFADRFGIERGGMISAVDLLRGIAKNIGWQTIFVPGITGYIDTDYAAKGTYAASALDDLDFVCVHIEAPDESGHEGSVENKIRSLEEIDAKVVPPILDKLRSFSDWRILISPDHPTPVSLKTHSRGAVPWLVAGSDIRGDGARCYDEVSAAATGRFFPCGWMLMPEFLRGNSFCPPQA